MCGYVYGCDASVQSCPTPHLSHIDAAVPRKVYISLPMLGMGCVDARALLLSAYYETCIDTTIRGEYLRSLSPQFIPRNRAYSQPMNPFPPRSPRIAHRNKRDADRV